MRFCFLRPSHMWKIIYFCYIDALLEHCFTILIENHLINLFRMFYYRVYCFAIEEKLKTKLTQLI